MKKSLLFLAMLGVFTTAQAQYPAWTHDFNTGDATGWTILDKDGDGNTWQVSGILNNDWIIEDSEYKVLSTYRFDAVLLEYYTTAQNNWAISPQISLAVDGAPEYNYGGTIKLKVKAQPAYGGGNCKLRIYASVSPDYNDLASSFTDIGIVDVVGANTSPNFVDYEIDITNFITTNAATSFYFAMQYDSSQSSQGADGIDVNAVSIDASDVVEGYLGIDDIENEQVTVQLQQNPVSEILALNLNEKMNTASTILTVYNMLGTVVKTMDYNSNGMDVSGLTSGMYILQVTDGVFKVKTKFIKK